MIIPIGCKGKVGHATTAYHSMLGKDLMEWGGVWKKHYGMVVYMEHFFNNLLKLMAFRKRCVSWGDLIANTSGARIYWSRAFGKNKGYKWSILSNQWIAQTQANLLGSNFLQQSLKDYNGQVYWLSFTINVFKNFITRLFNVAIGYGADGMYGNPDEVKQEFASLDINLRNINKRKN